jgi:uncharacterized protein with ParB-like and HNH nuclease domain
MKKTKNKPVKPTELTLEEQVFNVKKKYSTYPRPVHQNKIFEVGENVVVRHGGFKSAKVLQNFDNLVYLIELDYNKHIPYTDRTEPATENVLQHFSEVRKLETNKHVFELDSKIRYISADIEHTLHSIIHFGCDLNPPYQREFVWDKQAQEELLDSIFNNVDIGRIVLLKNDYTSDILYEVLDGKQRLTTLLMFYNDEITYKGYYYYQLPFNMIHHFNNFSFPYAEVKRNQFKSENEIYEYFIKLNTTGKTVSNQHLEKVKQLIK